MESKKINSGEMTVEMIQDGYEFCESNMRPDRVEEMKPTEVLSNYDIYTQNSKSQIYHPHMSLRSNQS